MAASRPLPAEMQSVHARALRALRHVRPANAQTHALADFWSKAQRTEAGRRLPEYYLVYFLLVELLGFLHQGPEEKVAWTIPLDFRGTLFTLEHRKMPWRPSKVCHSWPGQNVPPLHLHWHMLARARGAHTSAHSDRTAATMIRSAGSA